MATCIVCNQTLPGDVQGVSDMAKLRSRLEKVLDESVPVDSVMCASCQFDLAQIEMYYTLLIVFRKRYSETAKQRLQRVADDTSRNILYETADSSLENMQIRFGPADSSESSTTHLPLPDSVAEEGYSNISTSAGQLEIVDVRTVKEEFPDDTSSNNTEPTDTTLNEYQFTEPTQAFAKTSVEGEPEVADLVQVKVEVIDPTASSTTFENAVVGHGSAVNIKRTRKSKKDQDPSYDPVTHKKKEKQRKFKQDKNPSYDRVTPTSSGQRRPGRPRKDDPQPPFTCPVCNKVFNDRSSFTTHSRRHTNERPHVCSECGKAFKDSGGLRQHMRTHTLAKVFQCSECSSAFISQRALDRHSLVHTESRPFPCDQCEKRFKSQERLRVHIKLEHVQGRKFLCNICGLATYTVGNLRVHLLTHSEVKPHQCRTCGKRCSTKLTLRNHELSHLESGRPKHLCPICGKTFMNKSNLVPHIKLHTGESQHHCTICNRLYPTGSVYRRHMLTHQDKKAHQCTECGKGFTSADNLKQHMRSHSDERPFKCPCGSAFRQKDKLQKHLRSKIHAQYEAQLTPAHTANASEVPDAPPDSPVPPGPLPVGLPLPTVVAPVPVGVPLVVESQHEQLYVVAEDPVCVGL